MDHGRTSAEARDDEWKKAGPCKNGCDLTQTQCHTYTLRERINGASRGAGTWRVERRRCGVRLRCSGRRLAGYSRDCLLSLFRGSSHVGHQLLQILFSNLKLSRRCGHLHAPIRPLPLIGWARDAAFRGKVKSVLKTLAPPSPQAGTLQRKRPARREPDGSFAPPRRDQTAFTDHCPAS